MPRSKRAALRAGAALFSDVVRGPGEILWILQILGADGNQSSSDHPLKESWTSKAPMYINQMLKSCWLIITINCDHGNRYCCCWMQIGMAALITKLLFCSSLFSVMTSYNHDDYRHQLFLSSYIIILRVAMTLMMVVMTVMMLMIMTITMTDTGVGGDSGRMMMDDEGESHWQQPCELLIYDFIMWTLPAQTACNFVVPAMQCSKAPEIRSGASEFENTRHKGISTFAESSQLC